MSLLLLFPFIAGNAIRTLSILLPLITGNAIRVLSILLPLITGNTIRALSIFLPCVAGNTISVLSILLPCVAGNTVSALGVFLPFVASNSVGSLEKEQAISLGKREGGKRMVYRDRSSSHCGRNCNAAEEKRCLHFGSNVGSESNISGGIIIKHK